jgi:hypothetical protein
MKRCGCGSSCCEPSCGCDDGCCGGCADDCCGGSVAPAPVEMDAAPVPVEAKDARFRPVPPRPMADPNAAIGRQRDVLRTSFTR